MRDTKDITPILLLDDIYDKLDEERISKLMEIVQEDLFGQVFISDTHIDRLPKLFDSLNIDYKSFIVKEGSVS